jgi:hypothetical protein
MDTPSSFYLIRVLLMTSSARPIPRSINYPLHTPYKISTSGGNIITKQVILSTPLNLAGKLYKTSLIVLDGQGIDVILGMSWMKEHKTLLDIVACTVQLSTPAHGMVTLQLSSLTTVAPSVRHTTTQNLEDVPVACEFLDVFPEDLPGMPLDQDVEFTIELQSCMAPISKRPYKMTPNELA